MITGISVLTNSNHMGMMPYAPEFERYLSELGEVGCVRIDTPAEFQATSPRQYRRADFSVTNQASQGRRHRMQPPRQYRRADFSVTIDGKPIGRYTIIGSEEKAEPFCRVFSGHIPDYHSRQKIIVVYSPPESYWQMTRFHLARRGSERQLAHDRPKNHSQMRIRRDAHLDIPFP